MAGEKTQKPFPFEKDETSDVPLWVQLRHRLQYLIRSGYYEPGEQLPTVRGLASEVSINYNTVNKAYLSLISDGYITSTRGRGAFVRDVAEELEGEGGDGADALFDECIDGCLDLGLSYGDIEERMKLAIRRREMGDDAR